MADTTPTPAAGQVEAAVKADVASVKSKVVAFLKKVAPYAAGLAGGLLLSHLHL